MAEDGKIEVEVDRDQTIVRKKQQPLARETEEERLVQSEQD